MRTTYWHKLSLVIPGIFAGFLLFVGFALPVHADETCLRGGDGNCIEFLRQTPAATNGVDAKDMMGQSSASNFLALQDGSMVALVGKHKASFGAPVTLNRYEIGLYYSKDGGVTWDQPLITNKGSWYVDEHLAGSNSSGRGMDNGAGFLGFDVSSVYDSVNKKTYITLAHTIACSGNYNALSGHKESATGNEAEWDLDDLLSFDEYQSACDTPGGLTDGSVFIDTIVYDHVSLSFYEVGNTRSITRSMGIAYSGGYSCSAGVCYGAGFGADHPSVAASIINNQLRIWVSFSGHRGGTTPADPYYWDAMKDQQLLDWNHPTDGYHIDARTPNDDSGGVLYVKDFWVRQLHIDTSTGALSKVSSVVSSDIFHIRRIPDTLNPAFGNPLTFFPGTSSDYVRGDFISSKIAILRGQYPIIVYSYSDSNNANLYPLNWSYWNGISWVASQKVQGASPSDIIKNNYSAVLNIIGATMIAGGEKISTVAGVVSPYLSYYQSFTRPNMVFHVATYGVLANGTYVPIYIRFVMDDDGVVSNAPQALVLVSKDNNNDGLDEINTLGIDGNSPTSSLLKVNANKGGPSIGWGRTFAYIAVPATSAGDAATIPVYTRVQPEAPNVYTLSDWTDDITSSWLVDSPPDDPNATIYSQPINSSPTSNEGFAQPKILNYPPQNIAVGGSVSPETATNVFSLEMLSGRSQNNTISCSAGNWCSVAYSGEYNTAGIRGWAWAEAVGWISLSCKNLGTCYSKSYDSVGNAWSTKEGGLYYGVRAVINGAFPSRTLIGEAWSERVGYISFDRSTGAYAGNQCGNPPTGYGLTYATSNSDCAYLKYALPGDPSAADFKNLAFVDANGADITLKTGSFIVDSEVINFTGYSSFVPQNVRRGSELANVIFKSVPTAHAAGTPVFWINGNDVTTSANGVYDIYRGINSYDASSYQLDGWARAESWATYQRDYCKNGGVTQIGSAYASPCDKEWGWIKLSGTWSTVHTATVATVPTIGSNELKATSTDGYPDPAETGQDEQLYIPTTTANSYLWTYSGLIASGANSPGFTMTTPFVVSGRPTAGTGITWVATLTQAILPDTNRITLSSTSGLLSSGKLRIRQDTDSDGFISDETPEIIEYSSIDTTTDTIEFVDRGIDGSTAGAWGAGAIVELVSETGNYNTFVIPIGDTQPERTLAGFGWSAPNTETLTPDPTVSRYKDNISGFGWVNFQPNKLEQIYPYLRTLFGNLYVGGDIEIVGPEYSSISPKQYTSTYQIQSNGSITKYIEEQQGASSGELQRCLAACTEETCNNECITAFDPSEATDISLDQGSASTLGKIPELDSLRTMVSECQKWDSASSLYVDTPCSDSNDRQAWQLSIEADFANLASTGVNKYGQQVIVCRANPSLSNPRSKQIFSTYTYNPPECAWELSQGFSGTVASAYPANQTYLCMSAASGIVSDSGRITFGNDAANMNTVSYTKASDTANCAATDVKLNLSVSTSKATDAGAVISQVEMAQYYKVNRAHTGRPTVYVIPDMYGNTGSGQVYFDDTPMQFNNAPEGESGAVSFVIPGSAFFINMPMRYCPQGVSGVPCLASDDIPYNSVTNPNPNTKITSTSQIASVAWFIDGSTTNLDGFSGLEYYPEHKTYRVGAFIVMGSDATEEWKPLGSAGLYWSLYMLNTNIQLNVYGLVMARNYLLTGQYYVQDENEYVIEPSENFIYDGRVVVNPPPGLEDLASGLPNISQAVP